MSTNPRVLEDIRKNVNQFINSLLEKDFIKITNVSDKEKKIMANSSKRHNLGSSMFEKIIKADKKHQILTDDEFSIFAFKYVITNLNEDIELVKIILKSILDTDKINFDDNTTYGRLLGLCFDQLHYEGEHRAYMKDVFLIEFRNAYTHLEYEINENEFSYKDSSGALVKADVEGLRLIQRGYIATTETIMFFLAKYFNLDKPFT